MIIKWLLDGDIFIDYVGESFIGEIYDGKIEDELFIGENELIGESELIWNWTLYETGMDWTVVGFYKVLGWKITLDIIWRMQIFT